MKRYVRILRSEAKCSSVSLFSIQLFRSFIAKNICSHIWKISHMRKMELALEWIFLKHCHWNFYIIFVKICRGHVLVGRIWSADHSLAITALDIIKLYEEKKIKYPKNNGSFTGTEQIQRWRDATQLQYVAIKNCRIRQNTFYIEDGPDCAYFFLLIHIASCLFPN